MKEIIEQLVQKYQASNRPHSRRRARGEWRNAVDNALKGKHPNTFEEIYDILKDLCKQGNFQGVGMQTIWQTAIETAERMGIPSEECLQCMHQRIKYVHYIIDNRNYMQLIPFNGWTLVYFLHYFSYALQKAMREQERQNND